MSNKTTPTNPLPRRFGGTPNRGVGGPVRINRCRSGPMVGEKLPTRTLSTLVFTLRQQSGCYHHSGEWVALNPTETTTS